MNRIKHALVTLMRLSRLRGEEGWVVHRPAVLVAVMVGLVGLSTALHTSEAIAAPTRSTTIALTSDETRLVVVNREANSVSIIQVKDQNGNDVANKLDEIGVGEEPRCVAVHPTDRAAYVTNAITGTV